MSTSGFIRRVTQRWAVMIKFDRRLEHRIIADRLRNGRASHERDKEAYCDDFARAARCAVHRWASITAS